MPEEHTDSRAASQSPRKPTYYLAGFMAAITFLVYLRALQNQFVWDDLLYITDNPHILSFDTDLVRWAFLSFHAGNWHPLTWMSHALDYTLWGSNPLGHHLTNVVLHSANTFIVVVLIAGLVERKGHSSRREVMPPAFSRQEILIAAGTTGVLFGVHPIHVESVAWVSERKDLLCALFYLMSISAYIKHLKPGKENEYISWSISLGGWYLSSFVLFVLALLSKPMAVSLPVVLLLLDWYPFNRTRSIRTFAATVLEKLPFIVLSLASSAVTVLAQKSGGALISVESIPLLRRLTTAAESLISYLWRLIVPLNLLPYYPYPSKSAPAMSEYLGVLVLFLVITAVCMTISRKQKLYFSAWAYFIMTLLPTLGIVQVGNQASADRYTYLPSIAPFLLCGIATACLWKKTDTSAGRSWTVKVIALSMVLLIISPMTYLTLRQIGIWKNNITLFTYCIEKEPEKLPFAYYNRGTAYHEAGQFSKAIADFTKAISLRPTYYQAYYNRGLALSRIAQFSRAIEDFDRAISLNPFHDQAYYNRGTARGMMGQFSKAIEDLDTAISLRPSYSQAYYNRGIAFDKTGQLDKAIADFDRAISLTPSYEEARRYRQEVLDKIAKKTPKGGK